jgi:hypothetical protein
MGLTAWFGPRGVFHQVKPPIFSVQSPCGGPLPKPARSLPPTPPTSKRRSHAAGEFQRSTSKRPARAQKKKRRTSLATPFFSLGLEIFMFFEKYFNDLFEYNDRKKALLPLFLKDDQKQQN